VGQDAAANLGGEEERREGKGVRACPTASGNGSQSRFFGVLKKKQGPTVALYRKPKILVPISGVLAP
jgi:hypothetical protein